MSDSNIQLFSKSSANYDIVIKHYDIIINDITHRPMCSIATLLSSSVDCVPLVSASVSCEQLPCQVRQEQNLSVAVQNSYIVTWLLNHYGSHFTSELAISTNFCKACSASVFFLEASKV